MTKRWGCFAVILAVILAFLMQIWGMKYCNYSSFTLTISTIVYLACFSFLVIDAIYTILRWKDLYYFYSFIRDLCWLVEAVTFFYLIGNWVTMELCNIIILGVLIIVTMYLSFIFTKLSDRYIE